MKIGVKFTVMLAAVSWLCASGVPNAAAQIQTNGIYQEIYLNISGSTIGDLLSAPNYPDSPDATAVLSSFQSTTDFTDYYGQRVRGYVIPPVTGTYTFWISSDDQSVLYLSTNELAAGKKEIASVSSYTSAMQWDAEDTQKICSRFIGSGVNSIIIEALMKEGSGGDNLAVRWQLPSGTFEAPIPASRLIPVTVPITPPSIQTQPTNVIVNEAGTATFKVVTENVDILSYQWKRDDRNISRATNSTYVIASTPLSENGTKYSCLITNLLGEVVTEQATLTVLADHVPPTVVAVQNTGTKSLLVVFSEPVYLLGGVDSFSLDKGASVTASHLWDG